MVSAETLRRENLLFVAGSKTHRVQSSFKAEPRGKEEVKERKDRVQKLASSLRGDLVSTPASHARESLA